MSILGSGPSGPVRIDVDRLIETRAVVMANSGGGKSWALRRLLEQTHGSVQQIVIDVEDEFATLREKYDYVLAGRQGGDCPADPRCAGLLARRLLELRVSAIIGIYELKSHDRIRFVRLFLESLVDAPKDLWHPAMVVIDEAHMFAPEGAKAESTQAVIDLMTRGRKRGFCGILASQRPAMLAKDASAQANNKLIGRFSQDVDVKRAAEDLGIYQREQQGKLRKLQPGHFYVVGPAFCADVTEVTVGPVSTTHPKAGQRALAPPPPAKNVLSVLAKLADLPAEAEAEAKTSEDLRREIADLKRQLRAKPAEPKPITERVEVSVLKDSHAKNLEESCDKLLKVAETVATSAREIATALKTVRNGHSSPTVTKLAAAPRPVAQVRETRSADSSLTGPEQRILDAIAWLEDIGIDAPEQSATAFLAGYTAGGGAFNNPRGSLRGQGLVEYVGGDKIRLTENGRQAANHNDTVLDAEELQRRVLARLPGPEQKILKVLLESYPNPLANDECARAAGYEPGGGAFNNPRGRLRSLGLIEYPQPGMAKARGLLFLETK